MSTPRASNSTQAAFALPASECGEITRATFPSTEPSLAVAWFSCRNVENSTLGLLHGARAIVTATSPPPYTKATSWYIRLNQTLVRLSGPATATFDCGTGNLTTALAASSDILRANINGRASEQRSRATPMAGLLFAQTASALDAPASARVVLPQPTTARDAIAIGPAISASRFTARV
jgi:hypothetical protein